MKKIGRIFILLVLLLGIGFGVYHFTKDNSSKPKEVNPKNVEEVEKSIFQDHYQEAKKIVNQMTIEEKVGQLFLVRYDAQKVEEWSKYYPGGYILYAEDFVNQTKTSMKKQLEDNQKANKYPLVFGVDEEGGYVTRVSRLSPFREEKFASPRYYYETGGYELLEKTEKEKGELLTSLGITLNLAPVADVSVNEEDFIYSRSLGRNAKETSEIIGHMVDYANEANISSCLKHFPGYGNNSDTHTGVAIDERSYENFLENDFLPFEAGIKEGAPCVMISHNIVKAIDEEYPSSLSAKVIHELRDTLDFTGIIMTDDLAMDAVKSYVDNGEAATLAVNAGNDMIITNEFETMYKEVLNSVKNGKIKEEVIDKAVVRIIAWKLSSGLFE